MGQLVVGRCGAPDLPVPWAWRVWFESVVPLHPEEVELVGKNSSYGSMKAVVFEKGQVTIPKALRDRMGIRPGQVLEFREENGRLVVTKQVPEDAFASVIGILEIGRSTDEVLEELRGPVDEP